MSFLSFKTQLASIMDMLVRSAIGEFSKLEHSPAVLRLDMWKTEGDEAMKRNLQFLNEQRTTQLASVMAILAKAAVAEIGKLADDGFAVLRLEMSRSQKENDDLKKKVQRMESELRTAGRQAGNSRGASESRSIGIQVRLELRETEKDGCSSAEQEVREMGKQPRLWRDGETITVKLEDDLHSDGASEEEDIDIEDDRPEILLIKEERLEGELWTSDLQDGEERNVDSGSDAGTTPVLEHSHYREESPMETTCAKSRGRTDTETCSIYLDLAVKEKDDSSLSRSSFTAQSQMIDSVIEQFICSHCGKSFDCFSRLKTHQQIHSGEKPYSCDKCGESFSYLSNLKRHERNIHSDKKSIHGSSYDRFDTKRIHINLPHRLLPGEKPFGCTLCDKSYRKPSLLKKHQVVHTGEKPYSCDICGKSFSYVCSLKSHQISHSGEKPFSCPQCGSSFTKKANLETHLSIHAGEKPFSCPHCGKSFSQKSNLKAHVRVHTGEKPFCCDECGECFIHANSLKTHKQIHTGKRPYSCETCGKSFSRATHVKIHQRIHTGDKPYSCVTCGKCFSQKGYLKTHQVVHTGVKDFRCLVCEKSFSQASCLKKHQRIHTGEKPFSCEKCGKCFAYQKSLKEHKCVSVLK
ncbi:zinc finger protein 883-like isoform X2 [Brienomyrus brachyistius]|uniref:zinc finger protein 883-like isoform X2 n=1 Tax=Brienomyrus brachyistius TaxID=42636 RepID=UPI0020B252E5|nr:zinc finger protein 883-like isoform X2 [Brienomyrus brachyistius]